MKSLKWEGIGTKNPFPHTSRLQHVDPPYTWGEVASQNLWLAVFRFSTAKSRDIKYDDRSGRGPS